MFIIVSWLVLFSATVQQHHELCKVDPMNKQCKVQVVSDGAGG